MSDPLDDKIDEAMQAQPPRAMVQATWNADGTVTYGFAGDEIAVRGLIDKLRSEHDAAAKKAAAPLIQSAPNGRGFLKGLR